MASFENLRREELMILTKLRNADDYKNMSRKQLKYIFATLSVTKLSLYLLQDLHQVTKFAPRPKKYTTVPASRTKKHIRDDYEQKKLQALLIITI